jgi:ATP-dependent phosphoenolpyruvate carboxykinase
VGTFILEPHQLTVGEVRYNLTATKLADLFRENFRTRESGVSGRIKSAGPA